MRLHRLHSRLALSALPLLLLPALALAGNPEIEPPPDDQGIWDGDDTVPCAWPSVVMVTGGSSLCSASLIHPKVVLYAAHCGYQDKEVRFGESQNSGKTEQVEYCKTYPGYNGGQGTDWAYCVLENEVTEVPFTPVGYGCEVSQYLDHGADIAIVGFGNNTGETGAGRKRWAFTKMFNPGPTTFNVGGNGYPSVCSGDSGGPALIRYPDGSWHVYGIASTKNDDTCSEAGGTHSRADNAAKWIENDSGIDVTVCHDNVGNWDPGPLCGGFFNGEPALSYGSWYTWCEDVTESGWSETCGPDFGNNAEAVAPEVLIVAPVDGDDFVDQPTALDITVAVADDSGFWDVYLEIIPTGGDAVMTSAISDENPTVFPSAEFYAGEYTLIAHATDFWGNTAASMPVTFTVTSGQTDSGDGDTGDGDTGDGDTADSGGSTGDEADEGDDATDDPGEDGLDDEVGDTFSYPGLREDSGDCSCRADREPSNSGWAGLLALALLGLRRRSR
jgi:MYXO-CTERM domain-containing protein